MKSAIKNIEYKAIINQVEYTKNGETKLVWVGMDYEDGQVTNIAIPSNEQYIVVDIYDGKEGWSDTIKLND